MSNSTDKELDDMLYEKAPELTDVEHLKLRDAIQAYVNNAVLKELGDLPVNRDMKIKSSYVSKRMEELRNHNIEKADCTTGGNNAISEMSVMDMRINNAVVAAQTRQLESILKRLKPGQIITRHKLEMRLRHLTKKGHTEDE